MLFSLAFTGGQLIAIFVLAHVTVLLNAKSHKYRLCMPLSFPYTPPQWQSHNNMIPAASQPAAYIS